MADPLQTVLRLRRAALDEARLKLAQQADAAARAHDAVRAGAATLEREAQAASDPSFDDAAVEAFAAWLPGARHRMQQARAEHERQEAELARSRAELAACRTAVETIETLITDRQAAARAAIARKQAAALLDIPALPHA